MKIPASRLIGLATFSLVSLSTQSLATPAIKPKCSLQVKAPDNGTGVMFDENCQIAYVLPPVFGEAKLSGLSTNTNLNQCPAVNKVGSVSASTMEGAEAIAKKIKQMIVDFEPLDKARSEKAKEVGLAQAELSAATSRYNDAKLKDSALMAAIETAATNFKSCSVLAANIETDCADQKVANEEARNAYRSFIANELSPAQEGSTKAKLTFDRSSVELEQYTTRYTSAMAPVTSLQETLFDLDTKIFDLYRNYASLEGVSGSMIYSVAWDKLLQDYQAQNPSLNVQWVKMPVKSAYLFANTKNPSSGADMTVPALLRSNVAGSMPMGPGLTGVAEGQALPSLNSSSTSPDIGSASIGFGNSLSSSIVLTLAGSCAYYPNGALDKSEISSKEFTAHMSPNVEYTYEVSARRGYTARYNMSNWVERTEKKSKRGGFFNAKNISSVDEKGDSKDWFSIEFSAEAGEFQYSPQEQAQITNEVRNTLIERALRNFATINSLASTPPPTPDLPTDTGAGAAAKNLRSACGWNFYCRAGSYILGTADSIWGSKTAVSSFKKSNNVWVEDKVNGIQILERSTALTFAPKN